MRSPPRLTSLAGNMVRRVLDSAVVLPTKLFAFDLQSPTARNRMTSTLVTDPGRLVGSVFRLCGASRQDGGLWRFMARTRILQT